MTTDMMSMTDIGHQLIAPDVKLIFFYDLSIRLVSMIPKQEWFMA